MDPKYNPETAKVYHCRYMKEYRGISVLWAVLTILFTILCVVAFVQPHWIGDSPESANAGHLGVYARCVPDNVRNIYICSGSFVDFNTILNDSFRAATFFSGVAALLMLIAVASLLLFFCFKKAAVFIFCGILELIVCVFMFLACVIYPSGWNHQFVKDLCGGDVGAYKLGNCNIRWGYILAILGIFDALFLSLLAFFLASRRAKIEIYSTTGTVTKSELNGYSQESMSKRSMAINPVVTVPDDHQDRFSEYSQPSTKAKAMGGRGFHL